MHQHFPLSWPPLDPSLRVLLSRLRESFGLSEHTVGELAWAAFNRRWDAAMVEAWARAKAGMGHLAVIPKGPARQPAPVDPSGAWAYSHLGITHGVLLGQAILNGRNIEKAWLGERPVSLKT
jgi:hypothetical protein